MDAERPAIPAPSVARRKRVRMRTISVLLSMGIHVGLIAALGAVVWTTIAPLPGAGGSGLAGTKINLESAAIATGDKASGSTPSRGSEASHPLVGSLEPIAAGADVSEPLQGLTSAPRDSGAAGGGESGTPLGASSLLGSLDMPGAGPTAPAPTGGAASVTFGGLGAASVGSVVYVVDCSGPMVTSLSFVKSELTRSVDKLATSQRFGVVLFHRLAEDGPSAESFAPVLVRATASAKELLHAWVEKIEPAGRSTPLAGLELALTLKPDAVFLLSRSIERSGGNVWELGLELTMARLEQLNPVRSALVGGRRGVLIQTIQFLDEDPTGIMQAIGQRHGGGNGYRVVKRAQDLQGEPRASRNGTGGGTIGSAVIDR